MTKNDHRKIFQLYKISHARKEMQQTRLIAWNMEETAKVIEQRKVYEFCRG